MSTHKREFYAVIFPSLQQLQRGITDMDDRKQKALCMERFRLRDEDEGRQLTDIDAEGEDECGICMETNSKIVLLDCGHAMCMKCYGDWNLQSKSCPFCRFSLKRVKSGDLCVYTDSRGVVDLATTTKENLRCLFMYIENLPLIVPDAVFESYDSHVK